MTKRLVLVAGNIASGKTSLAERLGARLGWRTAFESVNDNPYLADFYADMRLWSFHLQIFFLGHRAQQHLELAQAPQSAIADRSIYEDAHIFARALYHLGNLSERDYRAYRQVFDMVTSGLPRPDLLLYLQAPVQQYPVARGQEPLTELDILRDACSLIIRIESAHLLKDRLADRGNAGKEQPDALSGSSARCQAAVGIVHPQVLELAGQVRKADLRP